MMFTKYARGAALSAAVLLSAASAVAQTSSAPASSAPKPATASAPPKMPTPSKDYKAAPAGKYALDESHTGLVASVPHMGFSYSVFRFQKVSGTLDWDPAKPATNILNISVDPKSITTAPTSVDFSAEIAGDRFLKTARFPQATFVSKSFTAASASHGKVAGDLTLLGVTKPITFDVDLVGAGAGFRGPVIGVHAVAQIQPNDFGLPPPFFGQPITLTVDSEFDKKS